MTIILVLLVSVSLIFLYVLFAPFYLEINTAEGLFRFRFHRLASVKITLINNSPVIQINFMGIKKIISIESKTIKRPTTTENKKASTGKGLSISWNKLKRVLASFKIKKCYVLIDTGDQQLNGILYPVFCMMRYYSGKYFEINFIDKNEVVLEIENSIARMGWAYLKA